MFCVNMIDKKSIGYEILLVLAHLSFSFYIFVAKKEPFQALCINMLFAAAVVALFLEADWSLRASRFQF